MSLKKFIIEEKKRLIIYISILVMGFVLDRVSKEIVAKNLILGEFGQIEIIPNFLYFTYAQNTGGAWSILSNATWLLAIFSLVAVILISYYMFKKNVNMNYFIAGALVATGGLGNLYDRAIYGYVIDFIETYPLGYSFPIFNIADICVVIGSFYLLIYMFIEEYNNKKKSQTRVLTEEEIQNKGENDGRSN